MKIVAGLGNPGREYQNTRHNIGFLVVNELAKELSLKFKNDKRIEALLVKGRIGDEDIVFIKPQTYMNSSGKAILSLMTKQDIGPKNLIVIHDDLDLEFQRLRIKFGGGHGGHKGLLSIISLIGREFIRVRMGIGRPNSYLTSTDYVLNPFLKEEKAMLQEFVSCGVDALRTVVLDGVTAAMNRFNKL